jgi:hypothetical protein
LLLQVKSSETTSRAVATPFILLQLQHHELMSWSRILRELWDSPVSKAATLPHIPKLTVLLIWVLVISLQNLYFIIRQAKKNLGGLTAK